LLLQESPPQESSRMNLCIALLLAAAPSGGDDFDAGLAALREKKYKDAIAAFSRAEERAGEKAPAELLYDKALAAYGAGDFETAEVSAERAAARGGPAFVRARDFLRGNAQFQKCESAEKDVDAAVNAPPAPGQAALAADPAAYDK